MTSKSARRIAVLYQSVDPPIINGIRKPKKPGGYRDSGADICYVLRQSGHNVITASDRISPLEDDGWCFPDTQDGIIEAVKKGATHLWANTVLFKGHALQSSSALDQYASELRVIGQPPLLVEAYEDKYFVNSLLERDGRFRLPASTTLDRAEVTGIFQAHYPVVGKPIRGRGSYGVRLCHDEAELVAHLQELLEENPLAMIEEYLPGEEATITVMPPSEERPYYWSLPVVVRFNHDKGVAPYNGIVAITQNSRVPPDEDLNADTAYAEICRQCEQAAELLRTTAPIRIDVRRVDKKSNSKFAMFDVNMKPNMTGPGRPGREDQASLTLLAAERLGWTYGDLLDRIIDSSRSLEYLRNVNI